MRLSTIRSAIAALLHYPEWQSRLKTRGRKDASLRSRSNRRKAQRRSKG